MLQLQRLWGSRLGGHSGPPETVVVFSDHVVSHAPTIEEALGGRSGLPETVVVFSDHVVSHAPTTEALGSRLDGRSGLPETVVVFSDQVVSHAPTAEALGSQGWAGVRVLQKQSLSSATT